MFSRCPHTSVQLKADRFDRTGRHNPIHVEQPINWLTVFMFVTTVLMVVALVAGYFNGMNK